MNPRAKLAEARREIEQLDNSTNWTATIVVLRSIYNVLLAIIEELEKRK